MFPTVKMSSQNISAEDLVDEDACDSVLADSAGERPGCCPRGGLQNLNCREQAPTGGASVNRNQIILRVRV